MASSDDDRKTLAEETLAPEKDAPVDNPNCNGDGSNGVEEHGVDGTLAEADELFDKGSKAIEEGDLNEAVDCLSRALEIR
jgi:HAT1-interacting factor 1